MSARIHRVSRTTQWGIVPRMSDEKKLERVLRHIVERTNWAGHPHDREEVDGLLNDLFPEREDAPVTEDPVSEPPAANAPVADWRAWAVENGLYGESEAATKTKAELQAIA